MPRTRPIGHPLLLQEQVKYQLQATPMTEARSILITGCSSGVGREAARQLKAP